MPPRRLALSLMVCLSLCVPIARAVTDSIAATDSNAATPPQHAMRRGGAGAIEERVNVFTKPHGCSGAVPAGRLNPTYFFGASVDGAMAGAGAIAGAAAAKYLPRLKVMPRPSGAGYPAEPAASSTAKYPVPATFPTNGHAPPGYQPAIVYLPTVGNEPATADK